MMYDTLLDPAGNAVYTSNPDSMKQWLALNRPKGDGYRIRLYNSETAITIDEYLNGSEITVPLLAGELGNIGDAIVLMPEGKLKSITLHTPTPSLRRLLDYCDFEYDPDPDPHVNMVPSEVKPG